MTTLPTLILHHSPSAPFAQKVRLRLGCERMAWRQRMAVIGHGEMDTPRRSDERAGAAHAHFPRSGSLRLARAA